MVSRLGFGLAEIGVRAIYLGENFNLFRGGVNRFWSLVSENISFLTPRVVLWKWPTIEVLIRIFDGVFLHPQTKLCEHYKLPDTSPTSVSRPRVSSRQYGFC